MIDVHTHVVPLELPFGLGGSDPWPRVERSGERATVYMGGELFRQVERPAWDPLRRLEDMDVAGVARQVLSPMPELFCYWAAPAEAARYCSEFNGWLAAQCNDRFEAFGIVPLQDPELAAGMLSEVRRLGLKGVEVGSNVNGVPLHAPVNEIFLAEAERLGLVVFVHAFHPHGFDCFTGGPAASAVTFPNEIGFATAGLVAEGALHRHPELRICATHGGGSLGLILPRLDRMWAFDPSFQERLPESPSSYARRLYVDLLVFAAPALRYLLSVLGDRRVVVGSDYPFMPDRPGAVLDDLDDLSEQQRRWIRHDNAAELIGAGDSEPSPAH